MSERQIRFMDGTIEIIEDSVEARGRADIDDTGKGLYHGDELGGMKSDLEKKLDIDKKKMKWTEGNKPITKEEKPCAFCGKIFLGKTNQKYCSKTCRNKANVYRYRKKQRLLRNFKPYRGEVGQIYFIAKGKDGRDTITYVPAFFTETLKDALNYIDTAYSGVDEKLIDDYKQQIKEVIKE
jgi:predicted nucleic acid-binding Zn ribbon protein